MKQQLINKINKCKTMAEIKSLGMRELSSDSYGNYYMSKRHGLGAIRLNVLDMIENADAYDVEFDGGPRFVADDDISGWEG